MLRKTLLAGISIAALSTAFAATAQAQNTRTNCGDPAVGGNTCTVTQAASADNSSTVVINSGTGNRVTVSQGGISEESVVQITGNTNTVIHTQNGGLDYASTTIVGNSNGVEVVQGVNGVSNTSTVQITGSTNSVTVRQGTNANGSRLNTSTLVLNGNRLRATVNQNGSNANTAATTGNRAVVDMANSSTDGTGSSLNQDVSIVQNQNGNFSSVTVRGGSTANSGNAASTGVQSVSIEQRNLNYQSSTAAGSGGFAPGTPSGTSNPATQNVADVSLGSFSSGVGGANGVSILQDGVQNTVSVNMNRGLAAVAAAQPGNIDPATGLTFTPGDSGRNSATTSQVGRGNNILFSVGGRDDAGQQGIGNTLDVSQGGTALGGGNALGNNHNATVYQFGQLSDIAITQEDNTATVNSTSRQGNSTADVSQSAFSSAISLAQLGGNDALISQGGGRGKVQSGNSSIVVGQVDLGDQPAAGGGGGGGPFVPSPTPTPGGAARNYVAISQAGRGQEMNVTQVGIGMSATVFQRGSSNLNADGFSQPSNADIYVSQGFDGRAASSRAPGGAFVATTPPTFNSRAGAGTDSATTANATGLNENLTANVDQGGRGTVNIRQDGSNQSVSVLQNASSTATVNISDAVTATAVYVSQVGRNNSATVTQTGRNSSATVDQRNGNTNGGANTNTSVIQITQSGGGTGASTANSNLAANTNTAIAQQTSTGNGTATSTARVGPIGDADGRDAGTYGNRIEITQTNGSSGNVTTSGSSRNSGDLYARVEQQGAGQLAKITQTGLANSATILQGPSATNAIGIVSQSGQENTFFLVQTAANQFFRVSQTGGNNQTITSSGNPNGGFFANSNTQPTSTGVTPTAVPTP